MSAEVSDEEGGHLMINPEELSSDSQVYESIKYAFTDSVNSGELHHDPFLMKANGLKRLNEVRKFLLEVRENRGCCVAIWALTPLDSVELGLYRGHLRRICEESGFLEIIDVRHKLQYDISLTPFMKETLFVACHSISFEKVVSVDNFVSISRIMQQLSLYVRTDTNASVVTKSKRFYAKVVERILKTYQKSPRLRLVMQKYSSDSLRKVLRKLIARAYK